MATLQQQYQLARACELLLLHKTAYREEIELEGEKARLGEVLAALSRQCFELEEKLTVWPRLALGMLLTALLVVSLVLMGVVPTGSSAGTAWPRRRRARSRAWRPACSSCW